ncbi:MAG: DegT/DnrJ/EryC1/StrS family aminotransferase [Parcubacteria group bacterium]|nr:DegT/DnrJ/EryC1/StrS family aminotransferase [Parcubacteria group bacterium]
MNIPSTKPYLPEADIRTILKNTEKALRSGRLWNGPFLAEFERGFAKVAGTKYAVGMNSATSVLQAIFEYYDVRDREVITPTNTFVATSNAVIFAGGMPVLADMHPETLCIDPVDLKKRITKKTKGIILVHLGGLITPHIEEIKKIAKQNKLFLVEDASHAHGASRKGIPAGAWGSAAAFSFYATKVITSGGLGGMLTTNDPKLVAYARSVRFHGESKERGIQDLLGNDWSLSEPQAIMGLAQTKRLKEIVKKRMAIAAAYNKAFGKLPNVKPFPLPPKTIHSYYKYLLLLPSAEEKKRIVAALKERGIATGSLYWPPCHLQPVYQKKFGYKNGDFPVAEDILSRAIALPMYAGMTKKERDYVVAQVKEILV